MKKVTILNDLSGFGNCSLVANIAILSAFKIECHPIPTSVFSNQTEYPSFYEIPLNTEIEKVFNQWESLNLKTDWCYTGFLSGFKDTKLIVDYVIKNNLKLFVDPILGSNGKFYPIFDKSYLNGYKNLIKHAEIVTPNLTEACFVTDTDYNEIVKINDITILNETIFNMGNKLCSLGAKNVIITGVRLHNKVYTYLINKTDKKVYKNKLFNKNFSGTGDTFSSYVLGQYINSKNIRKSVKKATKFIEKIVSYSMKKNIDNLNGACFYKFIKKI